MPKGHQPALTGAPYYPADSATTHVRASMAAEQPHALAQQATPERIHDPNIWAQQRAEPGSAIETPGLWSTRKTPRVLGDHR